MVRKLAMFLLLAINVMVVLGFLFAAAVARKLLETVGVGFSTLFQATGGLR
jgi:hypothetical protein